jgi:hypothetical protein
MSEGELKVAEGSSSIIVVQKMFSKKGEKTWADDKA